MSAFDDAWSAFEDEAGPVLEQALSDAAPVVTGTLAGSMDWQDQSGTLTVGSRDPRGPIAAYVTRGTRQHEIYPVYADALHFIASDGAEVFTQHVHHPGTSANQFHITAWESVRDEVLGTAKQVLGHGVTVALLNPWRNRTLGG